MALVRVTYHHEDDAWWAESEDMPGFSAVSGRFDDVRHMLRDAAPEYFGDAAVEYVERLDSGAAIVEASFAAMLPVTGVAVVSPAHTYAATLNRSSLRVEPVTPARPVGDTLVSR